MALRAISYLRLCSSSRVSALLSKWVSFHFIFDLKHWPGLARGYKSLLTMRPEEWNDSQICHSYNNGSLNGESEPSFRQKNQLSYPINIARNVARRRAYSYYTLDTELDYLLFPGNMGMKFLKLMTSLPPNRNIRFVLFN